MPHGMIDWSNPVNMGNKYNRRLTAWVQPSPAHKGTILTNLLTNREEVGTKRNQPPRRGGTKGQWCLDFNGSNQDVEWATEPSWAAHGTAAYAIEGVIRPEELSGNDTIFRSDSGAGGTGDFYLIQTDGTGFQFYPNGFSAGALFNSNDGSFAVNKWHHIAAVRRLNGDTSFWVDGVQRNAGAGATANAGGGGNPFMWGSLTSIGFGYWNGQIQSMRMYRGIDLYGKDIRWLYEEYRRGYPNLFNRVRVPAGKAPAGGTVYTRHQLRGGTTALTGGLL
jgi:hypothetical protein